QEQKLIPHIPPEEKGFAYTGLVSIAVLCSTIMAVIYTRIRRKGSKINAYLHGFPPIWLFVAVCALLYSMGLPFIWGMEWMYDYISSFRQFRSLGWFALLFYYIATIFSVVVLFQM